MLEVNLHDFESIHNNFIIEYLDNASYGIKFEDYLTTIADYGIDGSKGFIKLKFNSKEDYLLFLMRGL